MPTRKHSCYACQKLRIGCDVRSRDGDPCSNCARRGRDCILEIQRGQAKATPHSLQTPTSTFTEDDNLSRGSRSPFGSPRGQRQRVHTNPALAPLFGDGAVDLTTEDSVSRRGQALTLHYMLWDIFTGIMEPQLLIWAGSECCPFKRTFNAPTTFISRLMLMLDNRWQDPKDPRFVRNLGFTPFSLEQNNDLIKQALLSAIHVFSARWLPMPLEIRDDIMQQLWSYSHRKMYAAMLRPTYCSILALYLFGITPTSTLNTERGASDLSLEISIRHYKQIALRSRIYLHEPINITPQENQGLTTEEVLAFPQMQDTAYWLGLICDISRAVTRCQPTILLPGRLSEEEVWECIRKEVSKFAERSQPWISSRLPFPIENTYSLIQHGGAHVILVWHAISNVQAALFHDVEGATVEEATQIALRELNRFCEVFGALLGLCKRDFILLNEKIRISTFLLSIHYNLGVLILVDTLNVTSYSHLMTCEYELRISSARAIVNFVSIILQTDHSSTGNHSENSNLLQVPYPEHVVNALSRAGHSLVWLYRNKSVAASMVETMFSVIFTALKILQRVSYSAIEEYTNLLAHCDDGLNTGKIFWDGGHPHTPVQQELQIDLPNSTDLFCPETVKDLSELARTDPMLLETTIARYEQAALVGPSSPVSDGKLRTQPYI
ncbi:hypothetical protein N431DRAFT_485641 [Stipitochalara longipes BDJ]|nr:hypothetical protein N431DRAFT_485641 [Stipitochalara longipes BDJ]